MWIEHILDILSEFGGGRGPQGNVAVRFLLAGVFWAVLAYVSGIEWRARKDARDRLILWAALLGVFRESLMFVSEYGSFLGYVPFATAFRFFPPAEHALTMYSGVLMAHAFLRYQTGLRTFSRAYVRAGVLLITLMYFVIAPTWVQFLNQYPDTLFGAFWGDLLFSITQSILLGIPLAILVWHRFGSGPVPLSLLTALSFFFLDELLMIPNLLTDERYVQVYAPIRHNLHIWAIPLFTWVYWGELQSREHEARQKSDAVLQALSDGLSIQSPRFQILYQNERHRSMFGDVVGQYCHQVMDDAHHPCERCPMQRMFATGQTAKLERWLPSLGRYLEISATPLRNAHGEIVAGLEMIHDLTARRVTERALFESEQRFRSIFRESAEPVLLVSSVSANIVDVNEAATALLGFNKKELLRHGFVPLMTHNDAGLLRDRITSPDLREGFSIEQQKMYRKGGEELTVTLNARLIRLRGENVYYCSLSDLTEKRRLDDYWRQSLEKLMQAEKMAFLGTMVSGFAHDINNPNQLVASNISLLADVWPDILAALIHTYGNAPDVFVGGLPLDQVNEAVPRAIRDIRIGSDRISKIVSNLMSFARSEEPTLKDRVHLNEVVENAISLLKHKIRKFTQHFEFVPAENLPEIQGSRQKLEQVVINLINNALESLPDESRKVSVTTRYSENTGELLLQVEDEGTGIPEDVLNRIGEPFFTTKQARGGSGLGLTISRIFIKEHGGALDFISDLNRGTKAVLHLPLQIPAEVSAVTEY